MSPFLLNYGYIRDKRSGVESYTYPLKEGQRYINLNRGRLFCSAATQKMERNREAHLNYYAIRSKVMLFERYCPCTQK